MLVYSTSSQTRLLRLGIVLAVLGVMGFWGLFELTRYKVGLEEALREHAATNWHWILAQLGIAFCTVFLTTAVVMFALWLLRTIVPPQKHSFEEPIRTMIQRAVDQIFEQSSILVGGAVAGISLITLSSMVANALLPPAQKIADQLKVIDIRLETAEKDQKDIAANMISQLQSLTSRLEQQNTELSGLNRTVEAANRDVNLELRGVATGTTSVATEVQRSAATLEAQLRNIDTGVKNAAAAPANVEEAIKDQGAILNAALDKLDTTLLQFPVSSTSTITGIDGPLSNLATTADGIATGVAGSRAAAERNLLRDESLAQRNVFAKTRDFLFGIRFPRFGTTQTVNAESAGASK
jgi:hypothetical protein